MTRRPAQIFLSYASEDALIASAVETAFTSLVADGAFSLSVIRDVHSFEQGLSITGQIQNALDDSDILFIIFTQKLKLSHSFTGFEAGWFHNIMRREEREAGSTSRRIVSLFLDELPQIEHGVLGIRLETEALDRPQNGTTAGVLDASGGLKKFLCWLSDLIVERQFKELNPDGLPAKALAQMNTAQAVRRAMVAETIMPKLESELWLALSSVVAKSFIEQKFLQLRWPKDGSTRQILDQTTIHAPHPDVFAIFGMPASSAVVTWESFKAGLLKNDPTGGPFIIDSLQNAVQSAFSEGPIDNDQVFLSNKEHLYRIIVTRYYLYFDSSYTMHVYFIPSLTSRVENAAEHALILLRLSTNFRSDFIHEDAPLRVGEFELAGDEFSRFRELVMQAVRKILLSSAAAHNCGLDNPSRFRLFFGRDGGIPEREIAGLYKAWRKEAETIKAVAAKIDGPDLAFDDFRGEWTAALARYIAFAEPINRTMGVRALERLGAWFGGSRLD